MSSTIPLEALGKSTVTDRRLTLQMQDEDMGALCCCRDEVYELNWYLQSLQKERDS